jgi:hypothetical protein
LLHVLGSPSRTKIRIDRLLYLELAQLMGAFDPILLDIDLPFRLTLP